MHCIPHRQQALLPVALALSILITPMPSYGSPPPDAERDGHIPLHV
ncbi:hypothetical protein [Desulfovibrio ferrophilus]|nr:hypothetical protein [Desulfovibrio ferrophilus]